MFTSDDDLTIPEAADGFLRDQLKEATAHTAQVMMDASRLVLKANQERISCLEAKVAELSQAQGKAAIAIQHEPQGDLLARIRQGMESKTVPPPGGMKASVDMTPELNTRMKRYLLDHGNPTTRQFFLVVLMEILNEEGY
jgi:hypothetical protein